MKQFIYCVGLIILLAASLSAQANDLIWKVNIISVLPSRPNVPSEFCLQFSPDAFAGPLSQLQQEGVRANNGILIKFRTFQPQQLNGLFFTSIEAVISRQLNSGHAWYNRMFIHLQQLSPVGVADGVWSTPDCRGRLVAQPPGAN